MNTLNQADHSSQGPECDQVGSFDFDLWVKAVKPQLLAALRGNFTITPSTVDQSKKLEALDPDSYLNRYWDN
ncbi:MAG: hypothetical protein HC835_12385 [Oscillatoriales cyanobacterium RM2_1_1]|nr:hypothetical protein [Oscillatoriales cyanobacterium RM2_1_1]